jgi:hypothetical protein
METIDIKYTRELLTGDTVGLTSITKNAFSYTIKVRGWLEAGEARCKPVPLTAMLGRIRRRIE